ncbi:MAG: diguanylate cyclase [Leptolyngbya sp. LCM1.Bin17]|nr:MAG: diguanylate cyclase [Leptolyngbya sp. LCM1.Bin17]
MAKPQLPAEYKVFGMLQTPIWIYQLDPFTLLWANTAAVALGPDATLSAHLSRLSQHQPEIWVQRLAHYRLRLSQGQTIQETASNQGCDQGCKTPMNWVGSGLSLADGSLGLVVEGQPLAGATKAVIDQASTHRAMVEAPRSVVAKAALHQQAETLQAIFDNIPLMLSIFDAQGQVEYINQAMEAELGWSLAEWQQQDLMAACYPDPAYRQQVLEHIHQASGDWLDWQTYTAAGHVIDIAWAHLRLSDGRIIGIGQNIGDRKRIEAKFKQQAQRDRLIAQVTQRISQSLELQDILDKAVFGLRQILAAHRVLVYALDVTCGGRVVAESVSDGYPFIQGRVIVDHCFSPNRPILDEYRHGRCQITADIYTSGLADCYVNALAQIKVRANLVIPIIQDERVWGLLACQQCDRPRHWQPSEIDMLTQMAHHLAIAIQQAELYHKLQHLATHDKLTGLPNRRYFDDYLEQEWRRLSREQAPLGLIFCDIDYFKQYNDTYGHLAGDDCLVLVAQVITRSIKRAADLTARYGGEEFAVILPNTDMAGVIRAAQRIRREIEAVNIPHRTSLIKPHLTLSMGLASWHPDLSLTPNTLKSMADQALYQAKQGGRDRYCLPSPSPP